MTLLLLSAVCDYCNPKIVEGELGTGWVVWRNRPEGACEYVFKTAAHAERWRSAAGLDIHKVVRVHTAGPVTWRMSHGSVRDIEHAGFLYRVWRTAEAALQSVRTQPFPHDAWLADQP